MQIYKRPESVLVLVHAEQQVLLLRRRLPPVGIWQSVTGSLEWDELPAAAAVRELAEETGLQNCVVEDCGMNAWFEIVPESRHRYPPGTTQNLEHVFRVELPAVQAIQLDPTEHDASQWVSAAEAAKLTWAWTNRQAIQRLLLEL
ncbi:MAG: dihydroneopterin triphosphate diphosphatase [Gammaproteobacteria bacterium]|nr:dihydroneopterin triphosphate diphosphatase [Gammaproteobacteria bacterium]